MNLVATKYTTLSAVSAEVVSAAKVLGGDSFVTNRGHYIGEAVRILESVLRTEKVLCASGQPLPE